MPANEPYGLAFWRGEVDRAATMGESHWSKWQENLNYYTGTPLTQAPSSDYVNVNVDFYQVEQKGAQLFFETPELQLSPGVGFDPTLPGVLAFRALLNALLGPDRMDVLPTILKAIKDCTCTAGFGPTVIGYQPTLSEVDNTPQPGNILGLNRPIPVPIHEAWFWDRIASKKFLVPADFTDTDYDKAPWLGMRFRIPFRSASRLFTLPPDFTGTTTADDKVLESGTKPNETPGLAYVDGVLVWYQAALFDDDVIHPLVYRRHVIIDGLDTFADKTGPMGEPDPLWASPYQTLLPNGRLRADSVIGNPIHVLTLRDVPDSAYVPSDSQMTRPLVKELCLFRTQMVQERDANKLKFGYNVESIPPEAVTKIEGAMTGSLIPLPSAAFIGGIDNNFREFGKAQQSRQTYLANDYIERDIQKTLGLGSNQAGVTEEDDRTATEISKIDDALQVRLDAERKRVVRWYLKGVDKVAALALRFCTDPNQVAELVGPEAALAYLQWRDQILQAGDPRPKFTARPNSQIRIDAARELADWLKIYEYFRKDPLMNGAAIGRKVFELKGEDPLKFVAESMPEEKPEPSLGYSFKGEDLNPLMPQFPIVLEVLAQSGVQISPASIQEAQAGAMNATLLQMAVPTETSEKGATKKTPQHGGLADKASPLSKHGAEASGDRPGPKVQ
jgi:hypothetical protein